MNVKSAMLNVPAGLGGERITNRGDACVPVRVYPRSPVVIFLPPSSVADGAPAPKISNIGKRTPF